MKRALALLSTTVILNASVSAGEFSGTLNSQTAYGTQDHKLQHQEWLLDLEYNGELWGGDITAIARARLDTVDGLNPKNSERPSTYSTLTAPLLMVSQASYKSESSIGTSPQTMPIGD